ncbi:histone-fold protein [Purpureocillium lavendulum]|uniref:Histone-fold protein n=1 Tax=Purpureocillium lavendulum TaxID=1247861 RepID=A0AB34FCT1_9HYPO|nr:histone-fold protein [Purpureocillium lavendulum]
MEQQPADVCRLAPPRNKDTEQRTEFFLRYSQVKAYPSMGGVFLGFFTAIQLKQLGLSNIEQAPRSHDNDEEDKLALAMMRQGAHWWPDWELYQSHYDRLSDQLIPYDFHFPPRINVGYPSSGNGVWVFKFSEDRMEVDEDEPIKPTLKCIPDGWYERINMAITADERCEVLKSFGATYYETVDDCEDIPKTLEEGRQRGKKYEELLRKMEDEDYLNRWLEHGVAD